MRHFFARWQTQRRTQPAFAGANASTGLCTPKRLLHPAHHTLKRPQHPAYHAPKRLQRPTRCVLCLQPSTRCPGTFGFHTAVCQSPTVCHTPCLLAHMVSHAIAWRPSSAQFSAQCPKCLLPRPQCPRRSQHPARHASRHLRHPTHRAPIAYSIRATASQALAASEPPCLQAPAPSNPPYPKRLQHPATVPPGAYSIRPTAPKRLQPSPEHLRLPSHCTPDSPSLPHNASLGSLA